ncbi:MAG: hypothetical protein ITG02_04280 [Patulibacter sp.]|nr:hypothetical protein [Patulibacter sp.]
MSRTARIKDLRRTVDRLPLATRVAMLDGLREERIIVGAYADRHGGVCPMLAAHRRGGRTDFLRFAQTWDRFTRAPSRGSRTATPRERSVLQRALEASIAASATEPSVALEEAISDHRELVARRPRPRTAARGGMRMPGWMRPVRTVEELEHLLEPVERLALRRALAGAGAGSSTATPTVADADALQPR